MLCMIVEASHLFRAGDKFQTQFFVMDVVSFLHTTHYPKATDVKVIVLHGSTKEEQAERYTAALSRSNVHVVRMNPLVSVAGDKKVYYKPTYYLHKMMGTDIPLGSDVILVGFHNPRYALFLKKYHEQFSLSVAAFSTPKKQGMMRIPEEFTPYIKHAIDLDECVAGIKAEFKGKKKKLNNTVL